MNILFVGLPGVPYSGRACDVRLCAFANIFAKKHTVTILNRFSSFVGEEDHFLTREVNVVEIVKKKNVSGIMRKLLLVWSILKEPFVILALNRKYKINVLHVYTGHFFDFLAYKLIGSCIGAKVIYQYVEFRMAKPCPTIYHKLNAYLCDKWGAKFWDASICISNYLEKNAKHVSKNIPTIKISPICDFSLFENIKPKLANTPYLLFCGSVGYSEVIQIIIDSYNQSRMSRQVSLKLVLSGTKNQMDIIQKKNPHIEILSNLDYSELIAYYKGAVGLFIPLRNTVEDIARFPNKICEYLASHGIIITTQIGEVPFYFKDNESAVIASDFDVDAMVEKLNWMADNADALENIRVKAYQVGLTYFDLKSNEKILENFLQNVCR